MDPTDSKVERSSTSVSANDSVRVGNSSTLESDEGGIALHAAEDVLIPTTSASSARQLVSLAGSRLLTKSIESRGVSRPITNLKPNKSKVPPGTDVAEDSSGVHDSVTIVDPVAPSLTPTDSIQGITLTVFITSSVY